MRSRSFARSSFGLSALDVKNFFCCVSFFRFIGVPLRPLYRDQSLHYALFSPLGVGVDRHDAISREFFHEQISGIGSY
jgi:hypothetical protein